MQTFLKILISFAAVALIGIHLFYPCITIDNIVLVLFGFAVFPWVGQLISSFEFHGIGAKFRGPGSGVDSNDVDIDGKTLTDEEIRKEYNDEK